MKLRKDEDNEIIKQIKESFQDPLASFDPIEVSSEVEAEQETSKITMMLNSTDWNQKSLAIQRSLSLMKGEATRFQSFNLTEIVSSTSLAILDVRSTLVKYGTLLITAAAQILGDNFVVCADFVIPNLFKQTNCGKLFISGSCKYTILSIVKNAQKPRVLKTIISESTSKSSARRLIVAESIATALQEWPRAIAMSITDIKNIIATLVSDPSQEVRDYARFALSLYEGTPNPHFSISDPTPLKRSPKKNSLEGQNSNLHLSNPSFHSPVAKKNLRKSTTSITRSPRPKSFYVPPSIDQTSMFEIDQVMPPFDEASADRFCKLLMSIIKAESYFVLNGLEFALPKSIIASSKLSSTFGSMVMMIPQLFSVMPDEFRENIAELIISTKINTRIIKRSFEQFGEDVVINNFIEKSQQFPNETILFFAEILRKNIIAKLDSKTENFLAKFIQETDFNKDSEVNSSITFLKQFLSSNDSSKNANSENEIQNYFGDLRAFILGDQFAQSEVQVKNINSFKIFLENNVQTLAELLKDSSNLTINLTLTFLLESFSICGKGIQLKQLFPILLDLINDPKHTFSGKAQTCLEFIVTNVEDLFPYLNSEDRKSVTVSFLSKFVSSQNDLDQSINQSYQELSNIIKPNLIDDNVTLRRQSIMIYAKLSIILGVNFQPIFVEMTPLQQKLINFYKDKILSNMQIDK